MKFCTIGCGGHATQAHGPAQARIALQRPEIELAACCDLAEPQARAYRDRFGFHRHYTDVETMLEREKPDAVSLIVPVEATCALAIPLLRRGVPLQLEKPPGLNTLELAKLVAAAESGGGPHQVAFNRRFIAALAFARNLLAEAGGPDEILQVNYDVVRFNRFDADFSTTAIHALDAALFLAGAPYTRARLSFQEVFGPGEDAVNIAIDAEGERGLRFRLNFQPVAGENFEGATVHLLDRTVAIDLGLADGFRGTVRHWHQGVLQPTFVDPGHDLVDRSGVFGATRAFLHGLLDGESVGPRLESCRQQVALMEAIRRRRTEIVFRSATDRAISCDPVLP